MSLDLKLIYYCLGRILKIIRYSLILIILAIIAGMFKYCELDPWVRAEKTYIKNVDGSIKVINTDKVVVTKTHKKFFFNSKKSGWKNAVKPQMASVLFSHKIHADENVSCSFCHHKNKNPERIKTCAHCHYDFDGYTKIHGTCSKCHDISSSEKCSSCHTGNKK